MPPWEQDYQSKTKSRLIKLLWGNSFNASSLGAKQFSKQDTDGGSIGSQAPGFPDAIDLAKNLAIKLKREPFALREFLHKIASA
jgi:hypothetical protein